MKTSELTDRALDWVTSAVVENSRRFPIWLEGRPSKYANYSSDWSKGGPIIEKEEIFLAKSILGGWTASIYTHDERVRCTLHEGPTPLVAAMRCFVASKLGDEVDVPAEAL